MEKKHGDALPKTSSTFASYHIRFPIRVESCHLLASLDSMGDNPLDPTVAARQHKPPERLCRHLTQTRRIE